MTLPRFLLEFVLEYSNPVNFLKLDGKKPLITLSNKTEANSCDDHWERGSSLEGSYRTIAVESLYVHAFKTSRIDYSNSLILSGLPQHLFKMLPLVSSPTQRNTIIFT